MVCLYSRARWVLPAALLLAPIGGAWAQAPVITSVIPMANARAVARNAPLTVTFSQPLPAASAGALKVFSSQRGGLRARGATPAVVSGNTLSFAPTAYPYLPGETVQYTVVPTTAPGGGAPGRVGQFTTAAGGTGNGNFQLGSTASVGSEPTYVLTGDVDGDGDLDMVTNLLNSSFIGVRLNNGTGTFSGTQSYVAIPHPANGVALGDVDGDGDLDLVATTFPFGGPSGGISVRLNDGTGTFGPGQDMTFASPSSLLLGDIDGDGDLDILAVSNTGPGPPVSVRLNDGTGQFSSAPDVSVPRGAGSLALGDMDNDGDLDLVNYVDYANSAPSIATVLLNTGTGTFVGTQTASIGSGRLAARALVDVDGDGDLDLTLTDYNSSSVQFYFNTGNGSFNGGSYVMLGGGYSGIISGGLTNVALGDVDGDGDLDLAATNTYYQSSSQPSGKVSIRLNNGRGTFSGGLDVAVAFNPYSVTMGDVDGDGDLDIVAACASTNPGRASVLLNQPGLVTAVAAGHTTGRALSLFPNPAASAATLTGAAPGAPISVLDALGRVLLTATTDATGAARLVLPTGLPAGVYGVRCGGQVRRLAVE